MGPERTTSFLYWRTSSLKLTWSLTCLRHFLQFWLVIHDWHRAEIRPHSPHHLCLFIHLFCIGQSGASTIFCAFQCCNTRYECWLEAAVGIQEHILGILRNATLYLIFKSRHGLWNTIKRGKYTHTSLYFWHWPYMHLLFIHKGK